MKVSIFENNIIYWVDYINRPDCIGVLDITDQDFQAIRAGTHKLEEVDWVYELVEIPVPIEEESEINDEEIEEEEEQQEE
jgi:hypothetical protein